ncbi:hypothetical protein QOZ88_10405 [Blastococcus sp. BMG 814]|uniref:Uncharacterized protein n=1 Tax=Blastococcus carthaginiensis TaxID=3050034 RepID=A0ABT9IBV9_9ACTN|nr:hypothetical protein [Blastococcus carthaginiensis]MDP5183052.1 hypothetical protein [Blastococcus carthaginiensis]
MVTVVGQAVAIGSAIAFLPAGSFGAFLASFLVLFAVVGMTNGSTYRMTPIIYRAEAAAGYPGENAAEVLYRARRDTAAAVGIISTVGALGALFIPRAVSSSYNATVGVETALLAFCGFYVVCVAVTWSVCSGAAR